MASPKKNPEVGDPMDRIRGDPILRPLLDDLCQWLRRILLIDISAENFTIPLQSGADLCRLAEAISAAAAEKNMKCPSLKYKPNAAPGSFQARCNIEAFVKWAKSLGVKETCLFETVDIVEQKYLRNVLVCLLEVSKKADVYGVEPPELVKLEKSTHLGWQELIKLSMKSTDTNTAMSVAAIQRAIGLMQKQTGKADLKSLVSLWKIGTKTALRSKGVAVSEDPDRILEESSSPEVSEAGPSEVSEAAPSETASSLVPAPESTDPEGVLSTLDAATEGAMSESESSDSESEEEVTIGEMDQRATTPATADIVSSEDTVQSEGEGTTTDTIAGAADVTSPEPAGEIVVEDITVSPGDQEGSTDSSASVGVDLTGGAEGEEITLAPTSRTTPPASSIEVTDSSPVADDLISPSLIIDEGSVGSDPGGGGGPTVVELSLDADRLSDNDQELRVEDVTVADDFAPSVTELTTTTEDDRAPLIMDEDDDDGGEMYDDGTRGCTVIANQPPLASVQDVILVHSSAPPPEEDDLVEDEEPPPIELVQRVAVVHAQPPPATEDGGGSEDGEDGDKPVDLAGKIREKLEGTAGTDSTPAYHRVYNLPEEQGGLGGEKAASEGGSSGDSSAEGRGVTWLFALCYPAIPAKHTPLTSGQTDDLNLKRKCYLALGLLFLIIGITLAIIAGILNPGSFDNPLPWTNFYIVFGFALACLIIGCSLIAVFVAQEWELRYRKRLRADDGPSYGTL